MSTRTELLAGFAASSGSGAVSSASASTVTAQRKGAARVREVTSSRRSVTTKLPFTLPRRGTLAVGCRPGMRASASTWLTVPAGHEPSSAERR